MGDLSLGKPNVSIVGCFQNGKSTLVNCLLDDKVAQTGDGRATTHINCSYRFGDIQTITLFHGESIHEEPDLKRFVQGNLRDPQLVTRAEVSLWKPLLKDVEIVDTPGFDANENDTRCALDSIEGADYILLVVNNKGLSAPEKEILKEVAKLKLPFSVIMNCMNHGGRWNPHSQTNTEICDEIVASIENVGSGTRCYPIAGNQKVWPCNLLWFWYACGHLGEESAEVAEDWAADLQTHFRKKIPSRSELVELSQFLPIRNFFVQNPWFLLQDGAMHTRAVIHRSVSNWCSRITQAIDVTKK